MTITSKGYTGTIMAGADLAAWVEMTGRAYAAKDFGSWRVSAVSGGSTRIVQAAAGVIGGQGVMDSLDTATNAPTLGTLASAGTRYDLIVARRTWQTDNATTLATIAGTSTRALPSRNTTPGTIDDHPLALVQLTRTGATYSITEVVDLRVIWRSPGLAVITDDLALLLLQQVGTVVYNRSSGLTWFRIVNASGSEVWINHNLSNVDVFLGQTAPVRSGGTNLYARMAPFGSYGGGAQFSISDTPGSEAWYAQKPNGSGGVTTVWQFDTNGNLTTGTVPHARLGNPTTITSSFGNSAANWSSDTSSSVSLYVWGPVVQLNLPLRRGTGAPALSFNSSGGIADTTIFTLAAAYRPRRAVSGSFRYTATNGGSYSGSFAIDSATGAIKIISGAPNTTIQGSASGVSVVVDTMYMAF